MSGLYAGILHAPKKDGPNVYFIEAIFDLHGDDTVESVFLGNVILHRVNDIALAVLHIPGQPEKCDIPANDTTDDEAIRIWREHARS